jgi:hypothetical protein
MRSGRVVKDHLCDYHRLWPGDGAGLRTPVLGHVAPAGAESQALF